MKKIIITLTSILGLLLLVIITREILYKYGYTLSLTFLPETSLRNLLVFIFCSLLSLIFILLLIQSRNKLIYKSIFLGLGLSFAFLFGIFFLFEQSTYNKSYYDDLNFKSFQSEVRTKYLFVHAYEDQNLSFQEYVDPKREVIGLLDDANLEEYNRGLIKDENIDALIYIRYGQYYFALDKDYTKIRIDLIVDGHLYLRTYSKYYIVDYNLGKELYDKTLSLERHN